MHIVAHFTQPPVLYWQRKGSESRRIIRPLALLFLFLHVFTPMELFSKTEIESASIVTRLSGEKTLMAIILVLLGFILVLIHYYRLNKRYIQTRIELESQKSILCARVSQEFKTPVSIIIGMTERIKEDLSIQKIDKNWAALDILSRQSENLSTLIDNVASIASLQRIDSRSNVKNGNVIAYLQYLYECFSDFTEAKQISYTFYSSVSEMLINYEPEYLRIILHNLIGISIKQCAENDQINLRIDRKQANKNYSIEVSHNGKELIPESMEIGLTVAEHMAEKLGGWMKTVKEPDGITVYSITFPLEKADVEKKETPINIRKMAIHPKSPSEEKSRIQHPSLHKPVVLIAQANKYLSYYLTQILEEKFQVLLETNGESALVTANQVLPDIIVSDAVLSRKNGFELCKEIKNTSNLAHIPVILITSTHSKEERVKGFSSGADACIERPLHENEFLAIIDQLLSTRKKIRESYIRINRMYQDYPDDKVQKDENLQFLERVTSTIYKEITNTENIIEIVASEVCLSSSQLNRRIKAVTGMTTSNYILKARLNKARKHLAVTHKPIGDIAMECGFNDFAYFSRSFKKEFGITPTTFQRHPEMIS